MDQLKLDFTSIAELAKIKKFAAYLVADTGRFLSAGKGGKVSGDAYQPCQWELAFVGDTLVTLRCVAIDKMLSAEKFLATKFFSGFVGEVSAVVVPEKAGPNERWQVIYGGRPGRFYLKSTHSLMLSISDKGRVRAELDMTPETNMLEVTFRLRSPSTVVAGDGEVDESGEELSRVWNDLDYADEHHSIAETQLLEKATKVAMAAKPSLKDSGSKPDKKNRKKDSDSSKPIRSFLATSMPWPLTADYVTEVVNVLASGVLVEATALKKILVETKKLLAATPNINKIDVPAGVRLTVVGDLHGQLGDLLEILKKHGDPSPTNWYLFNGDFVDRGPMGIEVLTILYCFKLLYPSNVFFNRGNHEARAMNNKYQFEDEVLEKYNKEIYDAAEDSFDMLPLCATIDNRVFVVHGGLFSTAPSMKDIANLNRKREIPIGSTDPASTLMIEMLWSDPRPEPGRGTSKRGAGVLFGPDVTSEFLKYNGFEFLIRSHEVATPGFQEAHDGKCITLFSASHYCGKQDNQGAVALFAQRAPRPSYTQYFVSNLTPSQQKPGKHTAALKADAIQQLKEQIFSKRSELRKYWDKNRPNKHHHTITVAQWSEGLNSVLGLNMKWHRYTKDFAKVDSENNINYKDFLASYRISLTEQTYRQYETLLVETCAKLYGALSNFTTAFRAKDTANTGNLSVAECTALLQGLNIGLNASGIQALLETLHFDSMVNLGDFCARFKVVYEQKVLPNEPWIPAALEAVGEVLLQRRMSFNDIAKTGTLSYDEFAKLVKDMPLKNPLSHDQRKTLAKFVDTNQNGCIDIKEFTAAFKVTHVRADAWRAVVDRLMEVFYKHRHQLKSLFRSLDTDDSGALDFAEFRAGLQGLNVLIDAPLTEDEILAVFRLFDRNGNELIDYDEFVTFLKDLKVDVV